MEKDSEQHDPALVERVARAIIRTLNPYAEPGWEAYRDHAIAAIDAVRAWDREHAEPSEAAAILREFVAVCRAGDRRTFVMRDGFSHEWASHCEKHGARTFTPFALFLEAAAILESNAPVARIAIWQAEVDKLQTAIKRAVKDVDRGVGIAVIMRELAHLVGDYMHG